MWKPSETETEYLWRVSLTGRYQKLLSDDEASGFWGLGVFWSDGPPGDQSITFRVAYWAGDVPLKEWGGLSELVEGVHEAASVQAMYE